MFEAIILAEVLSTVFYSVLGLVLMGVVWFVITWLAPFPVVKEIEEDQNMALAILMGAVFVGMAIIIAAVILS
ncbi:hypothetical protein OB2597_08544 [Pseudooceanicola batsensis HTCC2597]|uniref:DUF350 domain-containing protein n=1 Tax=Pseudooceanicola batsensis (strain ATCC BAA-863 / DSM 15984 / KCTC 12145 / HTCC2597) TaxID=252305 RepID=A3TUI1_PSEBH|nr:DUF350 domain-containing protein [Pseudooceanicola batsensis]EAQ04177.1 hypothetical protein OB2597_08544 [Pseudooceanicola batsensis HTCC2597]